MRILLINYHYFIHGGPDRYFFNIKEALEERGHTIIPFCFDYDETFPTPYRHFFPEPITGRGPSLLAEQNLNLMMKAKGAARMFHNPEVERLFRQVVRECSPDLVYSIYLSSSMLPKILKIAKQEFRLPVLYRLSDYHMLCGSYLFFRDGNVCQECLNKQGALIANRCMQGSGPASLLRYLQMRYIKLMAWYDWVDSFLCPSQFMCRQLIEHAGIQKQKVQHLPTFAPDLLMNSTQSKSSDYILFFGKVSPEKGVETLLRAYNRLNIRRLGLKLKLVGKVSDEYKGKLYSFLDEDHRKSVLITGPMHGEALWECVRGAKFVVQPALWFENMPNTILESMSAAKPIIASNLGSLPELVRDGKNGVLVPPGDTEEFAKTIETLAISDTLIRSMSEASRLFYLQDHTREVHLESLLKTMEHQVRANQ